MSQATQEPSLDEMWRRWRDLGIEQWSAMAKTMTESPDFVTAMQASLDWTLTLHQRWRDGLHQWLDALDLPRAEDLARLSSQVSAAETRVAQCEEQLDEMTEKIQQLEQALRAEQELREAQDQARREVQEQTQRAAQAARAAEPPRSTVKKPKISKSKR